ncbi:beta-1,3-galactosyltransferase 1-like [Sphaeramia orbicularis]|uniref:Hexosyltransferase n=1 Tax=Sphaeramia orbicularis TaxID=375764 RepID=A0A672ZVV7_9TELE|nr:beta-1,3-galactosyltransferase 1-like [Sphaeramia orbicularis]
MGDHGSRPGVNGLKRLEVESLHFPKKPIFNRRFLFLVLLCFGLCILCYTMSNNSFSWWEGFQLNIQYEKFLNRSRDVHLHPVYRVHPKPSVIPNETHATTKPPPTTPPGPQYHVAYPRNYHFIMDQADACKNATPFLVLMVPVAPHNVEARNAIRQTWGKAEVVQGEVVLTLFMLGLSGQADIEKQQEKIQHENMEHQDLILSDFIDSYLNLTIKTMVIMDWLATHCNNAAYAMKIDSDMFLNIDNLVTMLKKPNIPKINYLTGMLMWNRPVVRSKNSKWYVPEEMYPDSNYPTYTLGMGYIFSTDLPERFVQISKSIKPFNIEDAYIGMCMKKLGLHPSSPPDPSQFKAYNRQYNRCEFSKVITYILGSSKQLVDYWTDLKKPGQPC